MMYDIYNIYICQFVCLRYVHKNWSILVATICNIYTYYISSCNSILPIGIHMLPYVYLHRHCIDSKTSSQPSSHPAVCGMPASAFETAYWMAKYSLVDIVTLALHLYQTSLHAFLMALYMQKGSHYETCTSSHDHGCLYLLLSNQQASEVACSTAHKTCGWQGERQTF